jgi:hypothetical protein
MLRMRRSINTVQTVHGHTAELTAKSITIHNGYRSMAYANDDGFKSIKTDGLGSVHHCECKRSTAPAVC